MGGVERMGSSKADNSRKNRRHRHGLSSVAVMCCAVFALACGDKRRAVEANNKGYALLSQKRFAEAVSAFDQATAADPSVAEPYLGLGRAYDETQQLDKAEQNLRKYVSLRPKDGDGHYYLGLVLEGKKQDGEAAKAFRAADGSPVDTPRPRR
jgi:tetratricopeptide (TPR) repeat protein